eukprot:2720925-Rhodomonas_salina.1
MHYVSTTYRIAPYTTSVQRAIHYVSTTHHALRQYHASHSTIHYVSTTHRIASNTMSVPLMAQ